MKRFLIALTILAVPVAAQAQGKLDLLATGGRGAVAAPAPIPPNVLMMVDANLLKQAQAQGRLTAVAIDELRRLGQAHEWLLKGAQQARSVQQPRAYHVLMQQAQKLREAANAKLIMFARARTNGIIGPDGAVGSIGQTVVGTTGTGGTAQTTYDDAKTYDAKLGEAEAAMKAAAQQGIPGGSADAFMAQRQAMLAQIIRMLQEIKNANGQAMQGIAKGM